MPVYRPRVAIRLRVKKPGFPETYSSEADRLAGFTGDELGVPSLLAERLMVVCADVSLYVARSAEEGLLLGGE